jgi:ABC-type Fe3+-siderophore transport system permease subunit
MMPGCGKAPRLEGELAWLVNNQAFAAFPSMAIGQEHFAVILFVIAIVGIAFAVLVVLFLMFRNQHRDTTKTPRRFLLSNWK